SLSGLNPYVFEQLVDLGDAKKETFPEDFHFMLGQTAPSDDPFDCITSLERRFFFAFRKPNALIREGHGDEPGLDGPVPAGSKRCNLLAKRGRTQRNLLFS